MSLASLLIMFSVLTLGVFALLAFALRQRFGPSRQAPCDTSAAAPPRVKEEEQ